MYGFTPDVESLPVVGCFACRLEETKTRTDKKLGVRNSVGTFVGFATYRNVYGAVILTGKDTHIVGNLQVVFDSLFMPLKISLLRIQDWRLCTRSWGELTIG